MTVNYVIWCMNYTLKQKDIFNMIYISVILVNIYAISSFLIIKEEKRRAWSISLLNSFFMSIAGIIYLALSLFKHPHAFVFGADGLTLFYGLDNLSLLIWYTYFLFL